MNHLAHAQEMARRFNEAEVIQLDFADRRAVRLMFGSPLSFPDKLLDDLDWLVAVRTYGQTRAIALTT